MWALSWWIQLLPRIAPGTIRPIGRTVGVRIHSDAWAREGGPAAVTVFANPGDDFAVLLKGAARNALIKSLRATGEIFGLELFLMVAAVVAPGERIRGKRIALFLGNDSAAGPLIKASARVAVGLDLIASFWGCASQPSASRWVDRVSSEENPAGAPNRNRLLS